MEPATLSTEYIDAAHEAEIIDAREEFIHRQAQTLFNEMMFNVELQPAYEHETSDLIGLNPISSALNYLAHHEEYGPEDEHTTEALDYLRNDARTALFEALIARGHISETKSHWNEKEERFEASGLPIFSILRAGFDDRLILEEYQRRQAELYEESFITKAFEAGLDEDDVILTISPFPDGMDDKWAGDLGYRPENRKYMIRWVEISEEGERTTKQLSMSNSSTEVLNEFMRLQGAIGGDESLDSTEILAKPLLINKRDFKNVAEVAQAIDKLSSENVFLGDRPNGDSYERIEEASKLREEKAKKQVDNFVARIIEVAKHHSEGKISLKRAHKEYGEEMQSFVTDVAQVNPEMAKETIGEEASSRFRMAIHFEANGDFQAARELRQSAVGSMKDVYVCGMRISVSSEEEGAQNAQTETQGKKHCPEIKNGQSVRCPSCKKRVRAHVEGGKIYCTNYSDPCKLAKISLFMGKKK